MTFHQQIFFVLGAIFGLSAVAAGAFGSHLLRSRLSSDYLSVYEVAVRYQMYHALALILVAIALSLFSSVWFIAGGWLFIGGTLLFSGSLYTLVLSGIKSWGMVTPIGGTLLLFGWGLLVVGGLFSRLSSH